MSAEILVDLFADLTPASAVSGAIGAYATCCTFLYLFHDADLADFDPRPALARAIESGRVDPLLCAVANVKHDAHAAVDHARLAAAAALLALALRLNAPASAPKGAAR